MARLRICENLGAAGRVVRGAIKGDGDHVEVALGDLAREIGCGHFVFSEDLRELRDAYADEPGVAHHVENIGERDWREGVPEVRSQSPANIAIGGKLARRADETGGHGGQNCASCHSANDYLSKCRALWGSEISVSEGIVF